MLPRTSPTKATFGRSMNDRGPSTPPAIDHQLSVSDRQLAPTKATPPGTISPEYQNQLTDNPRPPMLGKFIAIIAGKRYADLKTLVKRCREDFPKCPDADDLPCGVIVGVVDLTKIWITDEPGMRFVWELRKPRLLKTPKPFAGGGGKIEVEAKLVRGLL
jgi:hypothetical protein